MPEWLSIGATARRLRRALEMASACFEMFWHMDRLTYEMEEIKMSPLARNV